MAKERLDVLVFDRGFAKSREAARAEIMAGGVFVGGQPALKPGTMVDINTDIEMRGAKPRYVSRGGYKLEKALEYFGVDPEGKTCIDCGASTGGFTDCLLQNGASAVVAVDVGYGQLAWSVRSDPRVTALERTNIRYLTREKLGVKPSLAVVDVSFISLALVLPVLKELLEDGAQVICLIKPQFEAGREKVGKKGVVRDAAVHKEVLDNFMSTAQKAGFAVSGITFSPIKGPEGNIEFLAFLSSSRGVSENADIDTESAVKTAHLELGE